MVRIEMSDSTAGYINDLLGRVTNLAEQASARGAWLQEIDEERAVIEADLAGMLDTLMATAKHMPGPENWRSDA